MLRLASAAVLAVILLVTLWVLPPWATAVLALVAALLCGGELANMAARIDAPLPAPFVGGCAALLVAAFLVDAGVPGVEAAGVLGVALLALVVAAGFLTMVLGPPSPASLTRAALLVMGPIYVGLPLGALAWVQWTKGPCATSWMLAVIAISDSAQYYAGRTFGRSKLAPSISPAKTRAGAVGGLIGGALAGWLLGLVWLPGWSVAITGLAAVVMALVGMAGDLFESLLKRGAGVKDSSSLIPGHGGLLDRIDSHLFAAPVFYVVLRLVG